jgi:inositol-phosphate phosphatase/L-galactose 1-phosphate phosphatase/histidinol-phosphatase
MASTLNGDPVKSRPCAALADAYFSSALPQMFRDHPHRLEALQNRVKSVTFGGDCYQYAMVATGFIDLVVERGLGIYDYLALVPIIEGAGGVITDWQGKALTTKSADQVVAAGDRRVLDQVLPILGDD